MNNAFDLTVNALREQGLNSDEILKELSDLFQKFSESVNVAESKISDKEKIKMLLKKICIPVQNQGYKCWVEAIQIYKKANGRIAMMQIYDQVAEKCKITPKSAERTVYLPIIYLGKRVDLKTNSF